MSRTSRWTGYRKHHVARRVSHKAKPRSIQSLIIYAAVILIILLLVYVSYTAVLPQVASLLNGQQAAAGAGKTVINVTYVKG